MSQQYAWTSSPTSIYMYYYLCGHSTSHESNDVRALCMAYVSGVSEGAQFIAIGRLHQSLFCLTDDEDNWHLLAAAPAYLKTHPEKTDQPTRALVVDALIATFPCHVSK